jgi:hypothetical protein
MLSPHLPRRSLSLQCPIGQPLDYEFADVMNDISFLARCVFFIDAKAVKKFGLATKANPKAGLRIASRQSDAPQEHAP